MAAGWLLASVGLVACAKARSGGEPGASGSPSGGQSSGMMGGMGGLQEGTGGTKIYGPFELGFASATQSAPCTLSADHRYLMITLENPGTTEAAPTEVTVVTDGTSFRAAQQTPELAPGASTVLNFDRALLAGFADNWAFHVELNGGEAGPLSLGGTCRDLRSRAHAAIGVLQSDYDEATGLYNAGEWWRGANMLETTIEYSRHTGNNDHISTIANTFEKNEVAGFINDYYDDMGWWALAWINAYDFTHNEAYLTMAKSLFADMTGGWDGSHCGGGIYWQKGSDAKVAIANELFLTVAARLHLRTPDDMGPGSYLEWAQNAWAWFENSPLLGTDHQIIADLDPDTCSAGWTAKFTYNQGVILGGLVDLAEATSDPTLIDQAVLIAEAALLNQADENGTLIESTCHPSCSGGDDLMFKGIFIRNLAYLYEARPLPHFREFLVRQSDAVWELSRSEDNEFGQNWTGPFDSASSARQAPGIDALVGAIRAGNMNQALGGTASGPANCGAAQAIDRAVDGNGSSKWCVGGQGNTLLLDLGEQRPIVGLVLRHAESGGETPLWNTFAYDLSVSLDGIAWTQVVEVDENTAAVTEHHFPVREARYVELYIRDAQANEEFLATRIYELEVLGFDLAPPD